MNAHNHRLKRIRSFLVLAEEERLAATRLMQDLPRQAAFFTQQAVEKLLRAVIEAEDCVAGRTHNIRELISILPQDNPLRDHFLAFEDLSSAATRYRYPMGGGGLAEPEPDETLKEDLKRIKDLQTHVLHFLTQRGLAPKD